MTYDEAIKKIVDNWDSIPKGDLDADYNKDLKDVVWIATHDTAGSYEVNEEWIGINKEGSLMWAYASGCSCWEGSYDVKPIKDIKTFEFEHKVLPEDWQKAIINFVENGFNKIDL